MAEVIHRYVGRDGELPERKQSKSEQEREQLDAEWRRKRISAESAKQRLHEAKMLAMRGELISKKHVTRKATFLVISLRQRLLALSSDLARKIAETCDADERVIAALVDEGVRDALDHFASLRLRVSDENWMLRLDGSETTSSKRPRRAT